MKSRASLSAGELATLDLMITAAQQRGIGLHEVADDNEDLAEAQMAMVEARWEARHGGMLYSEHDREVLGRIRELAATLETHQTLGELIELRAEAVRMTNG